MPPPRQPATFFSLKDLGREDVLAHNMEWRDYMNRLKAMSLSHDRVGGFYLMTADEAQDGEFLKRNKIGLVVSVLGQHSEEIMYPRGTHAMKFPVSWANGRDRSLNLALPFVAKTLAQGQHVAMHCLNSYHRGPAGLAAVLRALFGFEPRTMLRYIGKRRQIWEPYNGHDPTSEWEGSLGRTVEWAARLALWDPVKPVQRPRPVSSRPASSRAASSHESVWDDPEDREAEKQLGADKGIYLYRAMLSDGSDLKSPPREYFWRDGLRDGRLVDAIIQSVKDGSKFRSPFLHFSRDFVEARNWLMRGRTARGERNGYMVRVNIKELEKFAAASSQEVKKDDFVATNGKLIDLSNGTAIGKTFGKKWRLSDKVQESVEHLIIATRHQEVLVPFRGALPLEVFEWIDENTGRSKGRLGSAVARE